MSLIQEAEMSQESHVYQGVRVSDVTLALLILSRRKMAFSSFIIELLDTLGS